MLGSSLTMGLSWLTARASAFQADLQSLPSGVQFDAGPGVWSLVG